MKEFRTPVKVMPSKEQIGLKSRLLTQGSCFSDAIGDRLTANKLNTIVNPFGVMYNPDSIHRVLTYSIFNEPVPDHTYLQNQGICLNYNFHSGLSALTREELSSRLTNTIGATHYGLKDTSWLLITYGTAWVYRRKDTGEIVANCHKVPAAMFSKELMSASDILESFKTFYDHLKRFNDGIKIILTVSPVRHIKDTLELNSVSKSVLRVACHELKEHYDDVDYFPAYEMMVDDLRDYRFYKSDMLHPTEEAEDYIWEKFMERYFNSDLKDFVQLWKELLSALRHKPFHPEIPVHQEFLRKILKQLKALNGVVNVEKEIRTLTDQLLKE